MGILSHIYKQIVSLIKFIWFIIRDILSDFKELGSIIIKLIKKEQIVDPQKKEAFFKEISTWTVGGFLKENWYWLLVILFAGCAGYLLAFKYATIQCNNYIIETYIAPEMQRNFGNNTFLFNFT